MVTAQIAEMQKICYLTSNCKIFLLAFFKVQNNWLNGYIQGFTFGQNYFRDNIDSFWASVNTDEVTPTNLRRSLGVEVLPIILNIIAQQ